MDCFDAPVNRQFVKSIVKNLKLHYQKRELPEICSSQNFRKWIQFSL